MSDPYWCPAIRMYCSEVTILKNRIEYLEEELERVLDFEIVEAHGQQLGTVREWIKDEEEFFKEEEE